MIIQKVITLFFGVIILISISACHTMSQSTQEVTIADDNEVAASDTQENASTMEMSAENTITSDTENITEDVQLDIQSFEGTWYGANNVSDNICFFGGYVLNILTVTEDGVTFDLVRYFFKGMHINMLEETTANFVDEESACCHFEDSQGNTGTLVLSFASDEINMTFEIEHHPESSGYCFNDTQLVRTPNYAENFKNNYCEDSYAVYALKNYEYIPDLTMNEILESICDEGSLIWEEDSDSTIKITGTVTDVDNTLKNLELVFLMHNLYSFTDVPTITAAVLKFGEEYYDPGEYVEFFYGMSDYTDMFDAFYSEQYDEENNSTNNANPQQGFTESDIIDIFLYTDCYSMNYFYCGKMENVLNNIMVEGTLDYYQTSDNTIEVVGMCKFGTEIALIYPFEIDYFTMTFILYSPAIYYVINNQLITADSSLYETLLLSYSY